MPSRLKSKPKRIVGGVMTFDLSHARHDPAHCLAPGLFRSLKRGDRKKYKLDVLYQYGDGEQMRFIGFEPLGADDMRLLQGLVAIGGPNGVLLTPEPKTHVGSQLRLFLDPQFAAAEQDALVVRESMTRLLTEMGLSDGGDNIANVRASLVRMSNVTIIAMRGSRQASYHLMSHAFDNEDGRLFVALNPRLAEAILGKRAHARISMTEVRALAGDTARLMHQRLCGWIDPGKNGKVGVDTLSSYAWPDPAGVATMRKRRQRVREGLAELAAVGWLVDEYARGLYSISRPSPS